jgi:isoquinoline 1-oxidoreductase beta subunit
MELSRRTVLEGAGLVLGFSLAPARVWAAAQAPQTINAWIRIATDGAVTIYANSTDIGQGSQSGMAQIVAEELKVDWKDVRVAQAPVEKAYFNDGSYYTGGSGAIYTQWDRFRNVGAAARMMLIQAAAKAWSVPASQCRAERGRVLHPSSGRKLSYARLANAAARLPVPAKPELTKRSDWTLIGKPLVRTDIPAKVDGSAVYGIDVKLPGMLVATIAQCPIFGGRLVSMNEKAARAVRGVHKVVRLDAMLQGTRYASMPLQEAVAVVADGYWPAKKALSALDLKWEAGGGAFATDAMFRQLRADAAAGDALDPDIKTAAATYDGETEAEERKRVDAALAEADRVVDATYEIPMLAHATMEPMTAAARWNGRRVEIWSAVQDQLLAKQMGALVLGIPEDSVTIHTTHGGGGFGRRIYPDVCVQAALIARKAGAPVKLIWSRPEDMHHDAYRPPAVARFRAAVTPGGAVSALRVDEARIAMFGASGRYKNLTYRWPALYARFSLRPQNISYGAWRSVESASQYFFVEAFVDELAHALKQDPIAYRKTLLAHMPRAVRLLDALEEKSNWGAALPRGRARGVAFNAWNNSLAAQVAEVSVTDGAVRVERVTCAFDCGTAVNPDSVVAQGESAIIYGLSAVLAGEVTFAGGRAQQSNFDDYPVLKLPQCPEIAVHLLESPEAPVGGVGEPMTPPIFAAVTNALFAATGKRVRRLPLTRAGFRVV